LKGTVEELQSRELGRVFFPHGLGHLLGLDAHDTDYARRGFGSRILEPGLVITVEPGLYFIPYCLESISEE